MGGRRGVWQLVTALALVSALMAVASVSALADRGLVVTVVGAGTEDVERLVCVGDVVLHVECEEALTPRQIALIERSNLVIIVGSCPAIERLVAHRGVPHITVFPATMLANVSAYRSFIERVEHALSALNPGSAQCYRAHAERILRELRLVERSLAEWRGVVVTDEGWIYSALRSTGSTAILVTTPLNPSTLFEARKALESGGVAIVSGQGAASKYLEGVAKELGAPVVVLRFDPSDVLSSLRELAETLKNLVPSTATEPRTLSWAPPPWFTPFIAVPATLLGLAVALCVVWGLRPLPLLLVSLSSASSIVPVLLVSGEPLWIAVVAFSALGYSALSVLLSMRRLVFMGAAAPHTALLAALIGIVVGVICPRAVEPTMFLVGLGLMALVIYLSRFLETDIATGVVVGVTVSLSVLLLFAVTTVVKPPYSPWTLIVGDPLATAPLDAAIMACIAVGTAVYAFLGYRTHLVAAMDRDLARLSGARVALHEAALFASLSLMAVALVRIVGALLEHVFILLPAAIAIQMCRSCRETLAAATSISIACSLLGLYTSIALGIAPAGSIGIALAACYALSLALSRARR